MRNRDRESGQIMPMVALLMVVIIGMAAFAVDGSNIYSQHRKLQADLDVAVKVAASEMFDLDPSSAAYTSTAQTAISDAAQVLANDGYANTLTSPTSSGITAISGDYHNGFCGIDSAAGITICTPPQSGPFANAPHYDYVEGKLSQNVGGFFGGVLGLGVMHIGVRAVGWHGGFHEPYALISLDPNYSDGCILTAQGGQGLQFKVIGSIMSNTWSCITGSANPTITGHSDQSSSNAGNVSGMIQGSSGTNSGVPQVVDPYTPVTVTATEAVTTVDSTGSFPPECLNEVRYYLNGITTPASNTTYYFPPADGSPGGFDINPNSQNTFDLMPRCDGSDTGSPGMFEVTNDSHPTGKATLNSYNSVIVFDGHSDILDTGQATWHLSAPTSGPYQGIAISEARTNTEPPCSSTYMVDIRGNTTSTIDGVVDTPCAHVSLGGSSTINVNGALVSYDFTAFGHDTSTVDYSPSNIPADKGSVLVE